MDVQQMQTNVYTTIMGRKHSGNSYTATTVTFLDHFVPGDSNIDDLGDLIAGNVVLASTASIAFYSCIEGTVIGIKLEMVDYQRNIFESENTEYKD